MLAYDRFYINTNLKKDSFREQLCQLVRIVWDGDLVSKEDTRELHRLGLIDRYNGYNIINVRGIQHLEQINMLSSW